MSSREEIVPVLMTEPYFDCGRSNRWIVSMTSPVVNFMPRYIGWTFLQRPRYERNKGCSDNNFDIITIHVSFNGFFFRGDKSAVFIFTPFLNKHI